MVGLETVMSGILDEFPKLRKYRIPVLITVSTTFFFAGISMVTQVCLTNAYRLINNYLP